MPEQRQSREIRVRGLVQGVGFRPFVYRLAHRHRLSGWVRNTDDGVVIRVDGPVGRIEHFLRNLRDHPPKAAHIYEISQEIGKPDSQGLEEPDHEQAIDPDHDPNRASGYNKGYAPDHDPENRHEMDPDSRNVFRIIRSQSRSNRITQVCPDIAVCEECLEDMKSQPHRISYPFINCTHCGPRFTIIRGLPYDRPATTMEPFTMCETCRSEYESPDDRRFHAQPVACNACGPEYTLIRHDPVNERSAMHRDSAGKTAAAGHPVDPDQTASRDRNITGVSNILQECAGIIKAGGIIAIKGLGGFHLMCDAEHDGAVRRLRDAKLRDRKPFAVMVRDRESAARFVEVSLPETDVLTSWRRPIVLLKERFPAPDLALPGHLPKPEEPPQPVGQPQRTVHLAAEINPGCSTVGIMLPYMPFHHLLFEKMPDAVLVMTSGNLTDEPIIMDNREAVRMFRGMADATLVYNRDIHNRADDSVVFVASKKPRIIRRSRGFVPEPVRLSYRTEGILAAGAELSHCFAVGKGHEAMLSQHIGDLKDPSTFAFFEESVDRFCSLFRVRPTVAACDLHPDYLSTRYAHQLGLPVVEVQHHHAHIAACMAEFHLDEPVIGVCWDGTGLGTDNNIWGGEFFHADLTTFERFAHFNYLPLPGGDKAAKETWRTGLSLLFQTYGSEFKDIDLPFVRQLRKKAEWDLIRQAIERKVNSPLSSAAGRLFDAVAAITGVCLQNSYHAEAPMKLESIIDADCSEEYPFSLEKPDSDASPMIIIRFEPMVRALVSDLQKGVPLPVISARFHNTLVSVIVAVTREMHSCYGTKKVVLTGGVFQNRHLLEKTEHRLESGFKVYSPLSIPANDAGIALGQLAVAAKKSGHDIA